MASKAPTVTTPTPRRAKQRRRPAGGGDDPDASTAASAARLAKKLAGTEQLARSVPFNATKAREYGRASALNPAEGEAKQPPSYAVTGSTITESEAGGKAERRQRRVRIQIRRRSRASASIPRIGP